MPIYEFQCTECKEIFEEMVPVGRRTHKCPHCGSKAKKLISQVGIIFKGSGWYCTDNKGKSTNGNGKKKKEPVHDIPENLEETMAKKPKASDSESSTKKKKKSSDD
jgi:putative FmdB family regulatory protein